MPLSAAVEKRSDGELVVGPKRIVLLWNHHSDVRAGRRRSMLAEHSMTSMLHPRVAPLEARHAADTVGH